MSRRTREDAEAEDQYIRRHRRLLLGGAPAFDPTSLGVVGAWFDVASASNAGAGLAFTLPNLLSANHATTTTDARKPTIGAASNGVPILTCATSCLRIPLHAAINGATQWWISMHMRITSAAGNPVPFGIDNLDGEASTRKLFAQRFAGDNLNVHDAASPTTLARKYGPATLWPLNTWVHCIWELNLATGGAEATRAVVCVDGLPVVSSFTDSIGTPGSIPTAMAVPTGNMLLGAQRHATAPNPWVGQIGRYILIGNGAMPGVTSGCLTAAARLNLSAFGRPA
jgi:hypothetical protein